MGVPARRLLGEFRLDGHPTRSVLLGLAHGWCFGVFGGGSRVFKICASSGVPLKARVKRRDKRCVFECLAQRYRYDCLANAYCSVVLETIR